MVNPTRKLGMHNTIIHQACTESTLPVPIYGVISVSIMEIISTFRAKFPRERQNKRLNISVMK